MSTEALGAGNVVLATDLPLPAFIRGKVRDVYDLGTHLLLITTDRISAFDSILPTGIPDKGKVLNQLSRFWFRRIRGICPNHLVTTDLDQIQASLRLAGADVSDRMLAGRTMLGNKTRALPIECVVRGYLDGSGWKEYRENGAVCGIELPPRLRQGDRLPEPIFTPARKAHTGHDVNITHAEMRRFTGEAGIDPGHVDQAVRMSLEVYRQASEYALERGIIIADTKFEFGMFQESVIMIDECLTPDSSRFWDREQWAPGGPQPSFDKQYVRDFLDQSGWNREPPAPPLPPNVVEQTAEKYRDLFRRITGAEVE
jgi:phosphoribosylaminoimidazole-succinocarboxamide synthase